MHDKTRDAVVALIAKDYCVLPSDFPTIVSKVIQNDLFGLAAGEYTIDRINKEKPYVNTVIQDICILLSLKLIESRHAKDILEAGWDGVLNEYYQVGDYLIQAKLLEEIDDDSLVSVVERVIAQNTSAYAQLKEGKMKVLGFFIGKIMKELKGKGDPAKIREILLN